MHGPNSDPSQLICALSLPRGLFSGQHQPDLSLCDKLRVDTLGLHSVLDYKFVQLYLHNW